MTDTNFYVIENVDALYPRLNQTYKFDVNAGDKGKSVPCDALAKDAAYSMSFKMDKAQAKALYVAMNDAFVNCDRKKDDWHDKLPQPFTVDEDGMYIGKAKLPGAYNNKATTAPKQYDSKNNLLPADFLLTGGSTVKLNVEFYPYKNESSNSVALRLRAVQVIKYVPVADRSPFDTVDDGFTSGGGTATKAEPAADESFPETPPAKEKETTTVSASDDVFEEPKVKKSDTKPTPPKNDDDLGALLDEFDD